MTTFTNHVSFSHIMHAIRKAGCGASHAKVLSTFKANPKYGPTLTLLPQGKRTLLLVPEALAMEFAERWAETHRPKTKTALEPMAQIEFEAPAPSEEFIALQDRLVAMEAKLDRMLAIWSPA